MNAAEGRGGGVASGVKFALFEKMYPNRRSLELSYLQNGRIYEYGTREFKALPRGHMEILLLSRLKEEKWVA